MNVKGKDLPFVSFQQNHDVTLHPKGGAPVEIQSILKPEKCSDNGEKDFCTGLLITLLHIHAIEIIRNFMNRSTYGIFEMLSCT
uniref:Uncharacterized protein n=1 Tax=Anguilla anguilla TaxID=7936 RepID=A0A0E9VAP7_ANGAN